MRSTERYKPVRGISRRAFIHTLTGLGIVTLANGCRPRMPGPTQVPTAPPPAATATITGTATSTPTAAPTASATFTPSPPPATPTPPPTATPTPPPTPFPPGPPTKLGLFVTRNDPRIFDLLQTGNVALVKTMEYDPNFAMQIKQAAPSTLLVGRIDLPQIDLAGLRDPQAAAQAFADQLLPVATEPRRLASFDGWESFNEPSPSDPEQMARLAEFEAHRTRLLAAAGIRSVIGNFSTGMPPLEWWPQFRPALEAAIEHQGFLGLHEYSAPTMQFGTPQELLGWDSDPAQEGWLTLRYRKVYRNFLAPNNLMLPLLLTEVGIDGWIGDRPGPTGMGWKDFAGYWAELGMGVDAPGNYMELLAWYDAQLQQDPYVLGAAIFAAGASPGWETYEVLDEVFPFLKQYLSVHPLR